MHAWLNKPPFIFVYLKIHDAEVSIRICKNLCEQVVDCTIICIEIIMPKGDIYRATMMPNTMFLSGLVVRECTIICSIRENEVGEMIGTWMFFEITYISGASLVLYSLQTYYSIVSISHTLFDLAWFEIVKLVFCDLSEAPPWSMDPVGVISNLIDIPSIQASLTMHQI